MHHEPHEPRHEARHFHFAELRHGAVAAHGCHRAEVAIAERAHGLSLREAFQVLCQERALLYRHLRQLRVPALPLGVAFGHDALVADGKHAVESFHLVELVHDDAPPAPEVAGVEVAHGLRRHAAHPNKGARSDAAAVFEYHAVVLVVRHHLVEQHVHAHAAQVFLHVRRTLLAHGGQQARPGFHEIDMHEARRQVGVVLRQHKVFHFRECAGYFHARCAAAHDDHVEQFLPFLFSGAGEGAFEVVEQRVAQSHGLAHVLHRHGLAFHVLVAEEVGRSAGGQHQVVVLHLADRGLNNLVFGKNGAYLRHAVKEVLAALEDFAEGERDGTRLDARRCYLVNKRRELVVIVTVNEHHLKLRTFQFVG